MQFQWEQVDKNNVIKRANFDQDGFNVVVNVSHDYNHDWAQDRGKFIDYECENAIPNPRAEFDHGIYRFFLPDYTVDQIYKDLIDLDPCFRPGYREQEEHYMAMARKQVEQELLMAADPEGLGCYAVSVSVEVSLKGVQLAESARYGYETSDVEYYGAVDYDEHGNTVYGKDEDGLDVLASELVMETLAEANKKLQALREV